jgi:hypothetical protein
MICFSPSFAASLARIYFYLFIFVATYAFSMRNSANGCSDVLTNDRAGFPKNIKPDTKNICVYIYIYIYTENKYHIQSDICFLPPSQESYGVLLVVIMCTNILLQLQ